MMFCVPVKNGWQLLHTSTRNSGRVDPTVHSVPHEPQWTLASKYWGWISGFTGFFLLRRRPCRAIAPPVVAGCVLAPGDLGGRRGGLDRLDPDALLVLGGVLELDPAGYGREHGVIVAQARSGAREERHPALAHDDRARRDQLAVAGLDAQALAGAVAAVLDAAARLLV